MKNKVKFKVKKSPKALYKLTIYNYRFL